MPLNLACTPSSPERCDGVDQNCDGRIDDGCPWAREPAAIQLTAAWVGPRQLAIALGPPHPAPGAPDGEAGFAVDAYDPAPCGEDPGGPLHVASLSVPEPKGAGDAPLPRGGWVVMLQDGGRCPDAPPEEDAPTPPLVTLSLAVGGTVAGAWNVDLTEAGELPGRPVLSFEAR